MTDHEAKARAMPDYEAMAHVWLKVYEGRAFSTQAVMSLAGRFRSVAAEARKEALEEAAKECESVMAQNQKPTPNAYRGAMQCCGRIRALAGRKEGT